MDSLKDTFASPRATDDIRRGRRRISLATRRQQTVFAFLIYLGLSLWILWPIPLHPGSMINGPIGADLTGGIAYYYALAHAHVAPFLPGTAHVFNAPEGRATQWALNFSTLPSSTLLWLGAMAIGSVQTFAAWAVMTYTLSALSMFLLVRWLTGSWQAGLVAGLAWGFWPFVYVGRDQPLGDIWVLVICVWRVLVSIERPTIRDGVLAGLATAFALMWVQYFLIMVGVTWVVMVISALIIGRLRGDLGRTLRCQLAGVVPIVLVLAAIGVAGILDGFSGVPTRAASDLTTYAARPAMYLLPDPANPINGGWTKPIIRHLYESKHSTASYNDIYLGWSVMALAAVGLVLVIRAVRRRGLREALADRATAAALILSAVAVVGFLFSCPPHVSVFGVSIPTPNAFVGLFTDLFRTSARFALLVMLGLCILLGVTVARVIGALSPSTGLLLTVALGIVVTGDLWARNPTITRIKVPSVYRVLARQPPGIYAVYPLLTGSEFGGDSETGFLQQYSRHDLFEGFFPGTRSETTKLEFIYPTARWTMPALASFGVRYVMVQAEHGRGAPPDYPRPGAKLPGTTRLATDAYGTLYRITASPRSLGAFTVQNFSPPEGDPPNFVQWMTGNNAEIQVHSRRTGTVRVHVRFSAASLRVSRFLRITSGAGQQLYSGTIPTGYKRIAFTMTVHHLALLHFKYSPPAVSPHALNPADPDTRMLAIQISSPIELPAVR